MSAKILCSLSDEKPEMHKQIGCMNGFLRFFFITHSHNRRLTQGENDEGSASKRSKDKEKHQKIVKETPTEQSRASVSSSTGSTLSSQDHDWATKPENPPFSSPNTSHRFPIKNVVIDSISTIGSPITTPKKDSPRLSSLNESFRSIGSNHSAPVTPLSRNNASRLSYDGTETRESFVSSDGTETRESFVSGLKVRDLPRLSLDSRQRTISKSGKTENLPEELGSYRAPSNIVAKLMGLEAISDCSSTNPSPVCLSRLDLLSRSSRTRQPNEVVIVRELEVSSEPENQSSVTVYGEIQRRLADIDFKKSGKDLRALKQILETIHREKKAILEKRHENSSFDSAPRVSEGPEREKQQNIKSPRSVKKDKFVRGTTRERSAPKECNEALGKVQPVSTTRKIAKDSTTKPNRGLKGSKLKPRLITEVNVKTSGKISESASTKTTGSRTKKHNHLPISSKCRDQKASQTSNEIGSNSFFSEINEVITSIDRSPVKYDSLQKTNDDTHPGGAPGDGSFRELTISVQEQPSPVSVLDSAFYGDDSPSPVRNKPTPFQGFYADNENTDTPTGAEWKEKDFGYYDTNYSEQDNFKESSQTLLTQKDEDTAIPFHEEANLEKAYVAEILLASGFLDNHCALQLRELITLDLFYILEQTKASRFSSDSTRNKQSTANTNSYDKHRRKLIFDVVNEIVSQKMGFKRLGSQLRTGQQLLQEIYEEINQLEAGCSNQSLDDDEEDFLTTIIEKDLTHRSGNWTDNHISSETSGLVLDIERLIFKDLIVELIHDEASHEQARNQGRRRNISN